MRRLLLPGLVASTVILVLVMLNAAPPVKPASAESPTDLSSLSVATLAGGCFWCMEATFEKIDGVAEVISGYTGGHMENPTYSMVGSGKTGHTEAVQIYYDPQIIDYPGLLHYFWREIDPTDDRGQFADRGSEYRPAIFFHSQSEMDLAIASRDAQQQSGRFDKPIKVEIKAATKFYPAEDYHQDYYKTHSVRYKVYRHGSGRDQYLERTWGDNLHDPYMPEPVSTPTDASSRYMKPDDREIRQSLSEMQYRVTQEEGTEPPFRNEYWDNKEAGIYVDVVSGEPLFSSTDKYQSGTGWPSFSRPISDQHIVEKTDYKLLFPRTEVRSRYGDSHLGHLFNDGPAPTGLRYCINSASLRFIPQQELDKEGYGEFARLFSQ